MSIEFRPRARFVLGCAAVFGCFAIPPQLMSQYALTCLGPVEPVQRYMARAGRSMTTFIDDLASFRRAAAENRMLRGRVAELTEQQQQLKALVREKDEKLQMFGEIDRARPGLVTCEAEIIGEGAAHQNGILFIDRGSGSGLHRGMAVVAGNSVVGTISAVAPSVSSVLLVTSPASRFDAELASTGEPGVVIGNGDGTMGMKYVSKAAPQQGDGVVTRGRDGVVPRHLLIGMIQAVSRAPGSLTYDITLRPVRDLGRLSGVMAVKAPVAKEDFPDEPGTTAR